MAPLVFHIRQMTTMMEQEKDLLVSFDYDMGEGENDDVKEEKEEGDEEGDDDSEEEDEEEEEEENN